MGHAEHPCVLRDEAVELLAADLQGSSEALLAGRRPTIEPVPARDLAPLPLTEQAGDLVRLQQTRQPEVVLLVGRHRRGVHPVRLRVEHHVVEDCF